MARKTKLTPALQAAIARAVSGGVPLATACRLAGVSEQMGNEWLQRGLGRDPDRPCTSLYAEFAVVITRARAEDEARRVLQIGKAGQGGGIIFQKTVERLNAEGVVISRTTEAQYTPPDWRADAWHLERSRPDQWAKPERLHLHITIEQLAAKVAQDAGVTPEEVLAEAQAILRELDHAGTVH